MLAAWSTAQSLTKTDANKVNVLSVVSTTPNIYWQYRLNGTNTITASWLVRSVVLLPKPTNWSKCVDITTVPTNAQNLALNQYHQTIVIGATNRIANWEFDKTDLVSKFTAIDLGKRYNIDTLALTDADDSLYRIHYSLENTPNYASTTSWVDVGDITASTTLSNQFTGSGKALRWFRFNRISEIGGENSSNPQALAHLASQISGHELYRLQKNGTFMERSGINNAGAYIITLPNTAIGQTSVSQEYRICNGNIGPIKNFIIKLVSKSGSDGYKSGQLSWNNTNWYSWNGISTTTGAMIDYQTNNTGYGSTSSLPRNAAGDCSNYKSFWVRTYVPSTGVNEGVKEVRFYFEALVL
ncbi:MAG: hypothetical protein ABH888_03910 [Patescibacteria group bacterium]